MTRWIGMADVRPLDDNDLLGAATGAYVSVVGDADDEASFLALVVRELKALQFEVLSLEDAEPLEERRARASLPDILNGAIAEISDQSPLAHGSFHAYSSGQTAQRIH